MLFSKSRIIFFSFFILVALIGFSQQSSAEICYNWGQYDNCKSEKCVGGDVCGWDLCGWDFWDCCYYDSCKSTECVGGWEYNTCKSEKCVGDYVWDSCASEKCVGGSVWDSCKSEECVGGNVWDDCASEECVGGWDYDPPLEKNCPYGCDGANCKPKPCEPDCSGKVCGGDGCGGSCGSCTEWLGPSCEDAGSCDAWYYGPTCSNGKCTGSSVWTHNAADNSACDGYTCATGKECSGGSCKTSTPAPTPTPTPVPAPTPCVPGASESCSSSCTPGCNGCVRSYDSCGQDEDIVVCCLYGCTGSSCDEPECTSPWTGSACTTSGCYDGHEYKSCTNNAYGNQYCKADIPYNYQCSGSTPECSSGTCVECAYNSHCGQGKYCTSSNTCSSCATQPGTCQQWKYSYGCTIEADPNCCTSDDTKPSSVSCLTDTCYVGTWQDKCVSNSWEQDWCKATRTSDGKYTQECDTSTQYCRDDGKTGSCNPITCSDNPSGCNSFLDCSLGTTVHCDAECSSGTSSGGKCANCDVDGDGVLSSSCGGNDCNDNQEAIGACSGSIPFCESVPSGPSPKCVECLDNDDCTTSSKPVCDTSTYTCVECAGDGDCTDSAKSVCDTSTNTCVACKDGDASTCGTNGCWLSGNPEGSFWPS
ncbi:MAG: hypothetical protein QF704_07005, partial [Anaerolineales bacterium]|nr:hypothetical protein [Anaerolineales bacterium]